MFNFHYSLSGWNMHSLKSFLLKESIYDIFELYPHVLGIREFGNFCGKTAMHQPLLETQISEFHLKDAFIFMPYLSFCSTVIPSLSQTVSMAAPCGQYMW